MADLSNNNVSSNLVSNNDISGNELGSNLYKDVDGKLYNKCNTTINSEEYYTGTDVALSAFGGALSIPFILSSLFCSCIITSLLTVLAYTFYKGSEKKITTKVGITGICGIIFLLLSIYNIVNYYKAKNQIQKLTNNPNARPCYSENKKQIIR